jgi:hypothetical protein
MVVCLVPSSIIWDKQMLISYSQQRLELDKYDLSFFQCNAKKYDEMVLGPCVHLSLHERPYVDSKF